MCGILGVLPAKYETGFFQEALDTLSHRGPDGGHMWIQSPHVMFGHRRLSILDLSDKGQQPMIWQNRYVVVFNGEIYNFLEVRKKLEKRGLSFETECDTEVLLAAYAVWGQRCVEEFNGMWAFAIWDREEETVFFSRDRFGVKPLYYSHQNGQLAFASEMKAIVPFLSEKKVSNQWQWCYANQHDYEGTEYTLLQGIQRFPAGHSAIYDLKANSLRLFRYWNTMQELHAVPTRYEDQVAEFGQLFKDACRLRLISDAPVATALSGGLDSSVIAASLAGLYNQQQARNSFQVFTASFPSSVELDELPYAQAVAKHLQLPLEIAKVDTHFSWEELCKSLWKFEDLYLTTPLPMMAVYGRMAEHGYKVSIDGHAGDELFAGYGHAVFQIVKDKPFDLRLINQLIDVYTSLYQPESKQGWKHMVDGFGGRKNFLNFYASQLFDLNKKKSPPLGYFNTYLYTIFHQTILPTLLRNYDRYSMTKGVEVRMPFLDYRVVKYAFSLGWEAKVRNGYTKAIVRDAFKDALPDNVIHRKRKIGFSSPMHIWFQNQWREPALDTIRSEAFLQSDLLPSAREQSAHLEKLLTKGKLSFEEGSFIWNALQPVLWENHFFKKAKSSVQ